MPIIERGKNCSSLILAQLQNSKNIHKLLIFFKQIKINKKIKFEFSGPKKIKIKSIFIIPDKRIYIQRELKKFIVPINKQIDASIKKLNDLNVLQEDNEDVRLEILAGIQKVNRKAISNAQKVFQKLSFSTIGCLSVCTQLFFLIILIKILLDFVYSIFFEYFCTFSDMHVSVFCFIYSRVLFLRTYRMLQVTDLLCMIFFKVFTIQTFMFFFGF